MTHLTGNSLSQVLRIVGGPAGTRLVEGFPIRNGLSTAVGSEAGGLHIENAAPIVKNCVFQNNVGRLVTLTSIAAPSPGALSILKTPSAVVVEDCSFSNNVGSVGTVVTLSGPAGIPFPTTSHRARGGTGAVFQVFSDSVFRRCVFQGNIGGNGWTAGPNVPGGPGCLSLLSGNITAEDCSFTGNTGGPGGTTMFSPENTGSFGGPGVLFGDDSTLSFVDCNFNSNVGARGSQVGGTGAINIMDSELVITRCTLQSNVGYGQTPTLLTIAADGGTGAIEAINSNLDMYHSIVRGNRGGDSDQLAPQMSETPGAGGIRMGGMNLIIEHCTITGNEAGDATFTPGLRRSGGIHLTSSSVSVSLVNSILWGNIALTPPTSSNPSFAQLSSLIGTIVTSNIQGQPGPATPYNSDPLFNSPTDLHLSPSSPAINAGTNQANSSTELDRDGDPRRSYAVVDLGAFEYRSSCINGAVGSNNGGPFPVLTINGNAGPNVDVGLSQSLTIGVSQPPGAIGPRPFLVLAVLGIPHPLHETALGAVGSLCLSPSDPTLVFVAVAYFPFPGELVTPTPTPWSFTYSPGLPFPIQLTFQGIVNEADFVDHTSNAVFLTIS